MTGNYRYRQREASQLQELKKAAHQCSTFCGSPNETLSELIEQSSGSGSGLPLLVSVCEVMSDLVVLAA